MTSPAQSDSGQHAARERRPASRGLSETRGTNNEAAPGAMLGMAGNLALGRLLSGVHARGASAPPRPSDPGKGAEGGDVTMRSPLLFIHRKCAACASGSPCGKCGDEEVVRRKVSATGSESRGGLHSAVTALRGRGRPMAPELRATFEPRLGRDLSGVRLHTHASAGDAARSIGARAFTIGQDIGFAPGEFRPAEPEGRKLIAHELVHVAQQEGRASVPAAKRSAGTPTLSNPGDADEIEADAVAERMTVDSVSVPTARIGERAAPRIARQQTGTTPAPDPKTIGAAVDRIMDALEGYTSRWDSENILKEFRNKDAGTVQALVTEIRARGPKYKETPEAMVDWLLGDLTEENRQELRKILIHANVPDMTRLVVAQVIDLLEGYTSESDSAEIYQALSAFGGPGLDGILSGLEISAKLDQPKMALWLFGDMDRANAERLRQHCFNYGGPRSAQYGITWTAKKIMSLVSGYTSHSDSTDIAWNFETTPEPYRSLVLGRLDELARADGRKSAEDALREDMDQSDLNRLRDLHVPLSSYESKRGGWGEVLSGAEWVEIVAEWLVCGVAGIITGALSVVWDFVKIVKDVVVAVWDLLMSLVYLLSGGAAGSSNWLAVKNFFTGIGKMFTDPGKVWDQLWGDLALEFHTIEGPFSDCIRAEFIVRKFVNVLVNVVLIFAAGYGAVKGAASALEGAAEFAELARKIGLIRALVRTTGRAVRATGNFITAAAGEVAELASQLAKPGELLLKIAARINTILLAAEDQGMWKYLRGQVGELGAKELEFWQDRRKFWKERALAQEDREADLLADIDTVNQKLEAGQTPADKSTTQSIVDDSKKLDQDSAALHDEVSAKDVGPATPAGPRRVEVGAGDIDAMRQKYGIPAGQDTLAVAKTDVEGLEGRTFEGASRTIRAKAPIPQPTPHIVSPRSSALFSDHAEQDVANHFIDAVEEIGLEQEDLEAKTLAIHISNPTGVCTACAQGLTGSAVEPGVLQQLSSRYPGLIIRVTWETGDGKAGWMIIHNGALQ